jgi:(+)-pinoresinol hydroxylase
VKAALVAIGGLLLAASALAVAADENTGSRPTEAVYESSIGGVIRASNLPGLLGRGFLVYNKWCTGCHAGDFHPSSGQTDSEKLSLVSRVALGTYILQQRYQGAVPAELEKRTDLTPTVVETFVRQGINAMPAFRKTEISDDELKALSAYLTRPRDAPERREPPQ